MRSVHLSRIGASGKPRFWRLSVHPGSTAAEISWGLDDGKSIFATKELAIRGGLQNRSIEEQQLLEVKSLVCKKIRASGYSVERDDFGLVLPNAHLRKVPLPMLAMEYKQEKLWLSSSEAEQLVAQPKLDGLRCVVDGSSGDLYSRGRKKLNIPHLSNSAKNYLPNEWIDAEIYAHGWGFQKITSRARTIEGNDHVDVGDLQLHVFDVISKNKNEGFLQRHSRLYESGESIKVVPAHKKAASHSQVLEILEEYISAGYEGVMLRRDSKPYRPGIRDSSLLKLKLFQQAEFECLSVKPQANFTNDTAVDGVTPVGSLECRLVDESGGAEATNTATFWAAPKMSDAEKIELWANRNEYLTKEYIATVRFQGRSSFGVPRFPVVVGFRPRDDAAVGGVTSFKFPTS